MEIGIDESDIITDGKSFSTLMGDLLITMTEDDCIEIFSLMIQSIGKVISEKRNNIINEHVQMMLQYINENYNGIISLDIIADYTNLKQMLRW